MNHAPCTTVIGIGNPLMRDEGIGCHLADLLSEEYAARSDVEIIDAGSAGFGLLHQLAGRSKAVLVDCARMGETPGTIRRFLPQAVRSGKELGDESLHAADLLRVLALSRKLGECPAAVVIFGIEPEVIAPGEGLSRSLAARVPDYLSAVRSEIESGADHA